MFTKFRQLLRFFSPVQILLLGFISLALSGAVLLVLPFSNADGETQSFLDALFMATSAVSTTGLGVVGTEEQYTLFGEIVILGLVQIGGLGYMTLLTFITHLFGGGLTLRAGNLMEESLAVPSRGEMRTFVRRVINFTLLFEGLGAIALTLFWWQEYPFGRALYLAIFHSISAFCTAGFSLFGNGFVAYQDNLSFNLIVNAISISGAIGFVILSEAWLVIQKIWQHKTHNLSVHSKLTLVVSGLMVVVGTAVLLITEPHTGPKAILPASFQTITAASTTGFNTVDIGAMSMTALLLIMVFMFIGSPAGGTGGGIKSTTFGVMLLFLWAFMKGNLDVNVFNRRLARPTLIKSMGIVIAAVLWLIPALLVLTSSEDSSFLEILFESISALGTVGLSMGLTPNLSTTGKIVIIATMFVGRVGPLSLVSTVFRSPKPALFRFPREEVYVG